ncbi:hypothetical protein [Pararhizobium sp.]|uniref:hypothetical protein n=1 Tax=Pararhizobium sp. TaxID=1977563 RepID=UPI002725B9C6|nr:hypothetical protein [Pararhizobium sp.]MDO9418906.1 flagellar biosynthetic protein FliO [Pararhizobium sp.]
MIDLTGQTGTNFIIAAVVVVVGLLLLTLVLWIMKNRSSSTFIRGGKNRQPRLAVLDAAAVDARRRLVLIRRDDVEHLIMIGGPTDIVIESRIGQSIQPAVQTVETAPAAGIRQPETRQIETKQPEIKQPETKQLETRPVDARPVEAKPEILRQPESRPDSRIVPDTRPQTTIPQTAVQAALRTEPRPEARVAPVSSMGQVLYSEEDEEPMRQARPAIDVRSVTNNPAIVTPVQARDSQARDSQAKDSQARESVLQQRPQTAEQRPALPVQQATVMARSAETPALTQRSAVSVEPSPIGITPSLNAEDILDAARARVLPQQRETPAVTPAQREPQVLHQPAVQTDSASDFERILDAQISGDLQRLTPGPQTTQAKPGERREPPLTTPVTGARAEPTIEQEMARMLGELSVSRNN